MASRPARVGAAPTVTFPDDGHRHRPRHLCPPGRRLRGDHRRLRRCPPGPPGPPGRAGRPGPGRRPDHRGGDLRPSPGHRGSSRIGAPAALRPRPEARAPGGGRGGPDRGGPFRCRAGQRDGRGVRGDHPGGRSGGAAGGGGRGLPLRSRAQGQRGPPDRDGGDGRVRGGRGVPPVRPRGRSSPGEPISSTRIRSLVAGGRVEDAAELLGRPHQVRGVVVHGDHRGGPSWVSPRPT